MDEREAARRELARLYRDLKITEILNRLDAIEEENRKLHEALDELLKRTAQEE